MSFGVSGTYVAFGSQIRTPITLTSTTGETLALVNAAGGILPALAVANASTQHGTYIQQTGVQASTRYALDVNSNVAQVNAELVHFKQDHASSTYGVLLITNDGTGNALAITQTTTLAANKHAIQVYSNVAQTTNDLAHVWQDHASSTKSALKVTNDGTGPNILCVGTTGPSIQLASVTTVEKNAMTGVNGAVVYDETLHKMCVYCNGGWQTVTSA